MIVIETCARGIRVGDVLDHSDVASGRHIKIVIHKVERAMVDVDGRKFPGFRIEAEAE